jgi:drug/metabolite transporter (DMT)-like permease
VVSPRSGLSDVGVVTGWQDVAESTGNTKLAIIAGLTMIGIYHLTVTDMATLRFAGAGAVFLPIVWQSGFEQMKALGWRRALALAVLAGLPYPLIINWGLIYAPAVHGAALCPASIVFFSFLLSLPQERVSRQRTIGVATIIVGLLLFIVPARGGSTEILLGDLLFVGSGLMFSAYATLVRQWRVDPVTATATVVLLSCAPLPLLTLLAPSGFPAAAGAEIVSQVVIQGLLAGAVAMFLYTYIIGQLGSQAASLFMPGVPIATVLVGMAVLGETPTTIQFSAIAIMATGMGFSAVARRAAREI